MIRYEFIGSSTQTKDIHPESVYQKEKELAQAFLTANKIIGKKTQNAFLSQFGIDYLFDDDDNLVAQIEVTENQLHDYFHNSELAQLRASENYQNLVSKNREELWTQQIEWFEGRCWRYLGQGKYNVVDYGSKNLGWATQLKKSLVINSLSLLEPLPPLMSNSAIDKIDIITAFDVLQRTTQPEKIVSMIYDKLSPSGLAVFTTRSGTGFDVLALGDQTDSVFPLDHLFLPSIKGLNQMFKNVGFKILEITTPGLLDVELVERNFSKTSSKLVQHMIKNINKERLQAFIQQNNLSSHIRVVVQK